MKKPLAHRYLSIAVGLAASAFVADCATSTPRPQPAPPPRAEASPPPPPPAVTAAVAEQRLVPNSEYSTTSGRPRYRVWYGTNRTPVDRTDETRGYSDSRDDQIHYGRCYVEVPRSHQFGSVGSSWIVRLVTWTDDRLKLEDIEPMDATRLLTEAHHELARRDPGKRTVLVYVHGYNVTFEEAAVRAAQIGFDLKVEGITAFFSWPSRGTLAGYAADEASVQAAEPYLEEFLTRVLRDSGAERVDVIAHSMGNRALLRVAEHFARVPGVRLGHIILAAPDVDQQTFRQMAGAYRQVSSRTTMYVSSRDRALQASAILHDYPRAGFFPPLTVLGGIDTIQVSNIDLTLLGHGYFADAAAVLYDIFTTIHDNAPPAQRIRLRPLPTPSRPTHWEISP